MAKTLREAPLTTRNARSELPVGVHFRSIDPEIHLGYRKGGRGGVWFVRWRDKPGYKQAPLGTADDQVSEGTLDFDAATRAARKHVEGARKEARATAEGPALTVRMAVEAYINGRDKRNEHRTGRKVRSDANRRLTRHLLGQEAIPAAPLADVALHVLSESQLLKWKENLPGKAATVRRTTNDLRAALNRAWEKHRQNLDATLPAIIKHGLRPDPHEEDEAPAARDNQILTDAQVSRLIGVAREVDAEQGWEGDLYRLVLTLAATGTRFSQAVRMTVGDVQRERGRLLVPVSRKGKGGKSGSTPIPVGTDILNALLPATVGRPADAPLLEHWRLKRRIGRDGIEWTKDRRGPWQARSEMDRGWAALGERAKMPGTIPYALRHSSIVRDIRQNLPLRLIAAKHDTSVAMIEKHYSKWIVSGLEELLARAVVPLVPPSSPADNVTTLRRL